MARWLRILVPAAGVVLLGVIIVWPMLRDTEPGFTLSFTDVGNYDDRLRMEDLKFEGTDVHGRPFTVTAGHATQEASGQAAVEMSDVTANVTMQNDIWLNLDASTGTFDNDREKLVLHGTVSLYSSLGYEVHSSDVTLDLAESTAGSAKPVQGQGPLGEFRGGGFTTDLKTERFTVTGGVDMTIYPTGGPAAATPAPAPAP
jgi:lipopolysaccharide export system protein LptC